MTDAKFLAAAPALQAARSQISPAAVPANRKWIAMAIAMLADALQAGMFPMFAEGALSPYQDALDVTIAIALTLLLGFRWRLAMAFAAELIPGMTLFPSWTAVVMSLPTLPKEIGTQGKPGDIITVDPVMSDELTKTK
jgi:hypothetical protein